MARKTKLMVKLGGLLALSVASFIIFYGYFISKAEEQRPLQPTLSPKVLNKPLPQTHMVDLAGTEINKEELLQGKVLLVSVTASCGSCLEEAQFLRTVMDKRNNLRFIGVISFGESKDVLAAADGKFPFKLYFDEGFLLARGLGINRVPIKIYLEDGVVKKTWVGSTTYHHSENEFKAWLDSLG